jgi:hypothetical protein
VKTLFLLVLVKNIIYINSATGPAGLDGVIGRNGTSGISGSSGVAEVEHQSSGSSEVAWKWNIRS